MHGFQWIVRVDKKDHQKIKREEDEVTRISCHDELIRHQRLGVSSFVISPRPTRHIWFDMETMVNYIGEWLVMIQRGR